MASIQVIFDNSLRQFASVLRANRQRARTIWLVTPWLSVGSRPDDPVHDIVDSLRGMSCTLYVVTRPPTATWHAAAIQLLSDRLKPIVLYSDLLHAKLYIVDCDGFRYAMLGSPNLTERAAYTNIELGIELRAGATQSANGVAEMIEQLTIFARSLLSENHVRLDTTTAQERIRCRT